MYVMCQAKEILWYLGQYFYAINSLAMEWPAIISLEPNLFPVSGSANLPFRKKLGYQENIECFSFVNLE